MLMHWLQKLTTSKHRNWVPHKRQVPDIGWGSRQFVPGASIQSFTVFKPSVLVLILATEVTA